MEKLVDDATWLKGMDAEPSMLLHAVGDWWFTVYQAYVDLEDGCTVECKGAGRLADLLCLWCSVENVGFDPTPIRELTDCLESHARGNDDKHYRRPFKEIKPVFEAAHRAKEMIERIGRLRYDAHRADKSADKKKIPLKKLPDNPDAIALARILFDRRDRGQSHREIALEFKDGDEIAASSLLRTIRRYPALKDISEGN